MPCLAPAAEQSQEITTGDPSPPLLRHAPENVQARSVSAEKWSQMAAELLRIEELRNPRLALECADRSLKIDPAYPFAYLNRGSAYMMLDQPREALADYTEAIRLAPGLSQAYFNRAVAHEALNQYQEAVKDFTVVLGLDSKETEALVRRAAAFFELLQDGLACKDLEKACQLGLCSPLDQAREHQLCPKNNH
ncbi:MAG: tetratricopeptide repeat protein [Desulfatibacillum sp.]|nr:tetratricopeptide repeat protein [Desulfatibacillum sp.]